MDASKENKHYLVDITTTSGDIENTSNTFVQAPDEASAKTLAIALESHDQHNFKWDNRDKASGMDMSGDLHYAADAITPVAESDIAILSKYQQCYNYDDYTLLLGSIPELWEHLMRDDPTMDAHVARYETGDATPDDYLLLATDTLINGNYQEAAEYIEQALRDDPLGSDVSMAVIHVVQAAGDHVADGITGDLIDRVDAIINAATMAPG